MKRLGELFGYTVALGAVLTAPWLIGGAEPWILLSLSGLVLAGAIPWLLPRGAKGLRPPAAGWAVLLPVLIAVQLCPLPDGILRRMQPTLSEWRARQTDLGVMNPSPVSTLNCAPEAGWRALYPATSAALIFLISAQDRHHRRRLLLAAALIALNAFFLALFAIVQDLLGTRLIYGFYRPPLGGTHYGPFTNRNHFGTWMNLALAISLGWMLYRAHSPKGKDGSNTARRDFLLLPAFMSLLMFASVLFSKSRGALSACLLGLGGGLFLYFGRRLGIRRVLGLAAGVLFCVLGLAAWLGLETVFTRADKILEAGADPLRDTRWLATVATLRMGKEAWLWGWGFGAFRHAFPHYQLPAIQVGRFHYAHNDYAQLFAEGGIIGVLLFAALTGLAARQLRRVFPSLSERRKAFVIALLCGLLALALQSAVDFGLHKPANGFLAAWICGMIAALATRENEKPGAGGDDTPHKPCRRACVILLILLCAILLARLPALLKAEVSALRWRQSRTLLVAAKTPEVRDWAGWDMTHEASQLLDLPATSDTLMDVCEGHFQALRDRRIEPDTRILMAEQAGKAADQVIRRAPTDYEAWLWWARFVALTNATSARPILEEARRLAPPGMELVVLAPGTR